MASFKAFTCELIFPDGKTIPVRVRVGHLTGRTLGEYKSWLPSITVREQPEVELLGTVWHEVLHATYPDLTEEAVLRGEHNLLAVTLPVLTQWDIEL